MFEGIVCAIKFLQFAIYTNYLAYCKEWTVTESLLTDMFLLE